MKRLFILTVALAVAMSLALATSRSDLERARTLCEEGYYREGIGLFDTILTATAGTDAAVAADEALDLCVAKLRQSDGADTLLREISRKYAGRATAAKALAALAQSDRPGKKKDCRARSPEFNELLERYGRSRETAREIIVRSMRCLSKMEHEREALADLEKVADAQEGNPEGAMALYWIGVHYRDTEDRDRAAIFFRRLVERYPETLEYPSPRGLKIVRAARTDLEMLRFYSFSPLFDRLLMRIRRNLLQGLLGMDPLRSYLPSEAIVLLTVQLGALALVLLPLPLLRRRGSQGDELGSGLLLVRRWSPGGTAALLAGLWTVTSLLNLLSSLLLDGDRLSFHAYLIADRVLEILLPVAMLLLVLRGEPLTRVFGIERKRLLQLVFAIPAAIVGIVFLAILFLVPLWWLGVVELGPDANHYSTMETSLRLEPWAWKIPLVILSATVEEVLFRGVLHDALRRRVPPVVAAFLGSFVFAAVHVRPLAYAVGTFAIGLVLVALRERFRSLTPGTIFHSLWNFLMLTAH